MRNAQVGAVRNSRVQAPVHQLFFQFARPTASRRVRPSLAWNGKGRIVDLDFNSEYHFDIDLDLDIGFKCAHMTI